MVQEALGDFHFALVTLVYLWMVSKLSLIHFPQTFILLFLGFYEAYLQLL